MRGAGSATLALAAALLVSPAGADHRHDAWDCDPVEFQDGVMVCIDLRLGGREYRGAEAIRFVRTEAGRELLFSTARGDEDVRRSERADAMYVLARVYPEEALPVLREALENDQSQRIREAAIVALAGIGSDGAVDALIEVASDSRERRSIRRHAIFFLGSVHNDRAMAFFDRLLLGEG